MLILEGPDEIGKTTAAKTLVQLAADHADRVLQGIHNGKARPAFYSHMTRQNSAFDFFYDYQDLMSLHGIQDRFHIGALVYHSAVITEHRFRIVEGWLASLASYTVVMYAGTDKHYMELLDRCKKDQMFDREFCIATNGAYRSLACGEHDFPPHVDEIWVSTPKMPYPDANTLRSWLDTWYDRLAELGRHV